MDSIQRVGVVTVTYNSAEVLPEFLASIFHQTFRDFLLYVVDNASRDNSLAIVSEYSDPRIRVIANAQNVGVAEGNNQGIRAALADGCDAVLLLNNDTVFPPELFTRLCDGLVRYNCAMTTPKMYYHAEPDKIWAAGGCFQPWRGYQTRHYGYDQMDRGQFDAVRTVTYTPTCCVLIHKEVFARIGLMDPTYFVYVDDVDFLFRALKAGFVMKYLPHCTLWHKVSSLTGGDTSDFALRYGTRNAIYFHRKHLPPWIACLLYIYWQTRSALAFLLGRNTLSKWKLRRTAAREGWRMPQSPTNALPLL